MGVLNAFANRKTHGWQTFDEERMTNLHPIRRLKHRMDRRESYGDEKEIH